MFLMKQRKWTTKGKILTLKADRISSKTLDDPQYAKQTNVISMKQRNGQPIALY